MSFAGNHPLQLILLPVAVTMCLREGLSCDGVMPSDVIINGPATHKDAPVSGNTAIVLAFVDRDLTPGIIVTCTVSLLLILVCAAAMTALAVSVFGPLHTL